MPLYDVEKRQRYSVEQTPSVPLLTALGLRQGVTVSVLSRQPLGGPIVVQIGKRSIAIAKDLAELIKVRRVS